MGETPETNHWGDRIRSEPAMTLQEGYRAIRERAALGQVAERLQIAVAGNDRAAYLQGLLTNDIPTLKPGTGCYSAWLSPQGRMLTDMHVLESGDMILLDVPAETAAEVLRRLEQFIFSEDVRVSSLADVMAGVWVHGPGASALLERVMTDAQGIAAWTEYHHARFTFGAHPVSIARISQLGVPGFCVYIERAASPALRAALERAGAASVPQEAIDAARIEAGYPVFGVDMTDDTIPLEAGIEQRAISFTKGCYVGQEVIIRVLHRGHGRVARRLVSLRVDGAVPARGARVYSGDREIGSVTSAAESPRAGTIALAYLHRDFTSPGIVCETDTPSGRAVSQVTEAAIPSTV